jgi:hypothetical protein
MGLLLQKAGTTTYTAKASDFLQDFFGYHFVEDGIWPP